MKTINVHEVKSTLSSVLANIEKKHEIYVICRNGKPIADLIPHRQKTRTKTHPKMGKFDIKYDPTEELTDDEWGKIK